MLGQIVELFQPNMNLNQLNLLYVERLLTQAAQSGKATLVLNSTVGVMMVIELIVVVVCFVTRALWLFCSERPQSGAEPQVDFVYTAGKPDPVVAMLLCLQCNLAWLCGSKTMVETPFGKTTSH